MLAWLKKIIEKYHLDAVLVIGLVLFAEGSILIGSLGFFNVKGASYYTEGDLLTLLGIVFAFLSVVGTGIYLWISKAVREDIEKERKQERAVAKSEIFVVMGKISMKLYRTLYKEATQSKDKTGKGKEQIDESLYFIGKAIDKFKEVSVTEYPREYLVIKNNLAYYLARKWDYYREREGDDVFRELLEKNTDQAQAYLIDKNLAENCMIEIKGTKDLEKFPDILKNIVDTELWVKRIFSVEPKVELPKKAAPRRHN